MARGVNKVILVEEYRRGDSIPMVAARNGVSRSTVRAAVVSAGVVRGRADAVRLAGSDGRLGSGMRGKRREFTESHRRSIAEAASRRGERDSAGVSIKPNGYVEVTRGPNKGRMVHRVVAEEAIGRPLRGDEVVHHLDHNKHNNDPSNLEVMSRASHTSLHRKENRNARN